jgi:hypothetical protein
MIPNRALGKTIPDGGRKMRLPENCRIDPANFEQGDWRSC